MFHLPFDEIIEKIKEKTNLSEEEINKKIEEKLNQLSGLISKEGAAHIIANELGVKVFDLSGKLKIKNIPIGMRNIETIGVVQEVYDLVEFETKQGKKGKVRSFLIGDETGFVRVVGWGNHTDKISLLKKGDVVKLKGAYSKENQGRKEIHLGSKSEIIINPEGEKLKEKKIGRKKIKDLKQGDYAEVLCYIVQVFDLNFFELCPFCRKKVIIEDGKKMCPKHKEVNPIPFFVLVFFIDDGTDNIRAVCFSKQLLSLLNKTQEELKSLINDKPSLEKMKKELICSQKIFIGQVKKNNFFDRLEFIVNSIKEPNPEEELRRLENAN